jgi:hypothetical protein
VRQPKPPLLIRRARRGRQPGSSSATRATRLLDLKTSAKLVLTIKDLWQVLGYALLDFDDDYGLDSAAIFSARHAYLAT